MIHRAMLKNDIYRLKMIIITAIIFVLKKRALESSNNNFVSVLSMISD